MTKLNHVMFAICLLSKKVSRLLWFYKKILITFVIFACLDSLTLLITQKVISDYEVEFTIFHNLISEFG